MPADHTYLFSELTNDNTCIFLPYGSSFFMLAFIIILTIIVNISFNAPINVSLGRGDVKEIE